MASAAAPVDGGLESVPSLETLPDGRQIVAETMAFKGLEKSSVGLVNEHKFQLARTATAPVAFSLVVHPR